MGFGNCAVDFIARGSRELSDFWERMEVDVEKGPALRRAGLDWLEVVARFWDQTELDDAKPALDLKTELEECIGSIKVRLGV